MSFLVAVLPFFKVYEYVEVICLKTQHTFGPVRFFSTLLCVGMLHITVIGIYVLES